MGEDGERQQQPAGLQQAGHGGELELVLMRGVLGSGKSTVAHSIVEASGRGVVLSTDDYVSLQVPGVDGYWFDAELLPEAHGWNQRRAHKCMKRRVRCVHGTLVLQVASAPQVAALP